MTLAMSEDQIRIERVLAKGPLSAAQLTKVLNVSQPTLSRTIRRMFGSVTPFRVSGDRTPRYGLLRQLPLGTSPRQKIYRVLRTGAFAPFAEVEFFSGGATLERTTSAVTLYEGLPPYMTFAAPSGFLGRQLAHDAAQQLQFPASLKDWGDEHRVAYLFTRGLNLPGNLVFGDASLQTELDLRTARPTAAAEKAAHFQEMATALKGAAFGSSAGGEQPKFLGLTEDLGHVIVKFAKIGSRMAELLPLEHLALRSLTEAGVPAAKTQLLASVDYVFLEVQRFDRAGRSGRVGMLSAGAVDDEFFGLRDTWSQFAMRCEVAGYLSSADARRVDTLAAFSELIGNTDRHFENISLLIDEAGEYSGIAPAYDILPMRYASIGGGVDPDLAPVEPRIGAIGAQPEVWSRAMKATERFWTAVQDEALGVPVSSSMKRLGARNLEVAREFVEPLLPDRVVSSSTPEKVARRRKSPR